jgi:choline dehydrogenase
VGCVQVDRTIDTNSRRQSTVDAFLPPHVACSRQSHLKICPNVVVSSVKIEPCGEGLQAVGVFFEEETERSTPRGMMYYASAKREIVLCAGTIGSPQILMLR